MKQAERSKQSGRAKQEVRIARDAPALATAFGRRIGLWVVRVFSRDLARREFFRNGEYVVEDVAQFLGMPEAHRDLTAEEVRRCLDALGEKLEITRQPVGLRKFQRDNIAELAGVFGFDEAETAVFIYLICRRADPVLAFAHRIALHCLHRNPPRFFSVVLGIGRREAARALSRRSRLRACGILPPGGFQGPSTAGDHRSPVRSRHPEDDEYLLFDRDFARAVLSPGFRIGKAMRQFGQHPPKPELGPGDFPHLADEIDILLGHLRGAVAKRRRGVNVLLHGPPGTGKTQLSRILGAELGLPVFEVAAQSPSGGASDNARRFMALLASQAVFRSVPTLFVFDEAEDVFFPSSLTDPDSASTRKAWFNELLETIPAPVVWISNSVRALHPAFVRRFDIVLEVPVPPRRQREKILEDCAGAVATPETLRRLADCEHLAPAVAARAASVVRRIRPSPPPDKRDAAFASLVSNTLKAQGLPDPSRTPLDPVPAETYDPDILETTADLRKLVGALRARPVARLCLHGPPGTGKTAFAHWLARELDLPLIARKASDLLGPYVGETEQKIRRAFDEARDESSVLLIDEMDSFLFDRRRARRSWEISQTNEMLTQIESFPGVFLASTNFAENFDPASLRRFDMKIGFGFLTPENAARLLATHCRALGLPQPSSADAARLASMHGLTPGDFALVARRHHFQPVEGPGGFVEALAEELEQKPENRRAVGFR